MSAQTLKLEGLRMGWSWEAVFAKYGWVLIGISFGFAAKYALLLKRGVRVKLRHVLADVLLLPTVALIAYTMAAKVGIQAETAALASALCTVGADRLVKLLTERFLQRVDSEIRDLAGENLGLARQVVQSELSAQSVLDDTMTGRAPTEYAALKPHPQAPKR